MLRRFQFGPIGWPQIRKKQAFIHRKTNHLFDEGKKGCRWEKP
jgi:hypothetical protein